jgi:hypothetical protein
MLYAIQGISWGDRALFVNPNIRRKSGDLPSTEPEGGVNFWIRHIISKNPVLNKSTGIELAWFRVCVFIVKHCAKATVRDTVTVFGEEWADYMLVMTTEPFGI